MLLLLLVVWLVDGSAGEAAMDCEIGCRGSERAISGVPAKLLVAELFAELVVEMDNRENLGTALGLRILMRWSWSEAGRDVSEFAVEAVLEF